MATKVVAAASQKTMFPLTANLSCEVHPLFAFENWIGLSKDDYDLLVPALQVATMYLKSPGCLSFFATLLFGARTIDASRVPRIAKEIPLTAYKAETIKDMLCELKGLYRFTFLEIENTAQAHGGNWADLSEFERVDLEWQRHIDNVPVWSARKSLKHGLTVDQIGIEGGEFCFPEDPRNRGRYITPAQWPYKQLQDPHTRMTPCTIEIHTKVLSRFKKDRHSVERSLQFNFRLAAVLLHELAHAVELGRPEQRELHWEEAIFPGETHFEMGKQLEKLAFGGSVYELRWTPDWMNVTDWPLKSTSQNYVIPLEWISRIQQQEFWDSALSADSSDPSLFHVPRITPRDDSTLIYLQTLKGFMEMPGGIKREQKRFIVVDQVSESKTLQRSESLDRERKPSGWRNQLFHED